MKLEECEGYKKLKESVERDIKGVKNQDCFFHADGCCCEKNKRQKCFHRYCDTFKWVIDRVNHYAEKTAGSAVDILNTWEKGRSYWYMNYYQDYNQPEIKDGSIRIFETNKDALKSVGDKFRCPNCKEISTNPVECNSGAIVNGKPCDWKAYGLFRFGNVKTFVKETCRISEHFMPLNWEKEEE